MKDKTLDYRLQTLDYRLQTLVYSLMSAVMLLFTAASCSPDSYSLGTKDISSEDLVEGIAYSITHDEANPNIIHLASLLPSNYQALWEHPQGRSRASEVTLNIAFPGTYTVRMGVETRGGVVYGSETTFTIDDFCSDFVSDELWTILTGGVGKSKKWYLDLDANEVCRYFVGPLYFYGTADNWNTVTLGETVDGDSWSWGADWDGQKSWLFGETGAIDFGYMEFGLVNGATIKVVDNAHSRTQTGTFLMDTDNHTMKITDAEIIHDPGRDAIVTQWGNITILALDNDHMQLAVLRDNSSEGNCLLSYNFISEDYLNNWTPDTNTEVTPDLPSDWRDWIEQKTNREVTYLLSDEKAFDWCNPDGTLKNIDAYSTSVYLEDFALTLHSGLHTYSCTVPGGQTVSGTYELSDDGVFTFSDGLPSFALDQEGKVMFTAANNQLRIMNYDTDSYSGKLSSVWLGSEERDDAGYVFQYQAVQLVPKSEGAQVERYAAAIHYFDADWNFQVSDDVYITGNGTYTMTINGDHGSEPYGLYLDVCKILKKNPNCDIVVKDIQVDGASVEFDDTVIDRGLGDTSGQENADARRYIVNPWGASAVYKDLIPFTSSLSVTIEVVMDNGTPFIAE